MKTVTVTIGRNVADVPMAPERWNDYVTRTREAVTDALSELWVTAPYRGEWEGVREDAFVFYGPLKGGEGTDDAFWSDLNVRELKVKLSTLATYYRQDAIGLSVGEAELVESFAATDTL